MVAVSVHCSTTADSAFRALEAALDELLAGDVDALSDGERLDRVRAWARIQNEVAAGLTREVCAAEKHQAAEHHVLLGVVVLGVEDVERAAAFWTGALGFHVRRDGFGGWATVLVPPDGRAGTALALQRSGTPPQDRPRVHPDLHVADAAEQAAEEALSAGMPRLSGADHAPDEHSPSTRPRQSARMRLMVPAT